MKSIKATYNYCDIFNGGEQKDVEVLILDIYKYDYGDGSGTNRILKATCLLDDGEVKDFDLKELKLNKEYVESIWNKGIIIKN